MPYVRNEDIWITNDSNGSSHQSSEGAVLAGAIGGLAAGLANIFGGGSSEPTLSPEQQQEARARHKQEVAAHEQKEKRDRISSRRQHLCLQRSHDPSRTLKKVHEEVTRDHLSVSERAKSRAVDMLLARRNALAPNQPGLASAFDKYTLRMPQSLVWSDENGHEPMHAPTIEELDLGFGGTYHYRGARHGVQVPSSQQLFDDYYRIMAQVLGVDHREAAVVVAGEIGHPNGPDGFARLRCTSAQIRARSSGVEVLKMMDSMVTEMRDGTGGDPQIGEKISEADLFRDLEGKIRSMQKSIVCGAGEVLARSVDERVAGASDAAVERALTEQSPELRLSRGLGIRDAARRNALGPLLSFSGDEADSQVVSTLGRGAAGGRDIQILGGGRRAARPEISAHGQGPSGRPRTLVQRARSWLADHDTSDRPAQAISESVMGDRLTEDTKKSWATWEEVGHQLSSRIMNAAPQDHDNVIRTTAHYYAVCWEKARRESQPTQCVNVFREHGWEATKEAMAVLFIDRIAKTPSKSRNKKAALVALYETLSGTMGDPRCLDSGLDEKVDKCVDELYKHAQGLYLEEEDE